MRKFILFIENILKTNKQKPNCPPFADPKISATTKKAIIGELTRPDAADDASGKILFLKTNESFKGFQIKLD